MIGDAYHNQYNKLVFADDKNGLVGKLNLGHEEDKLGDYCSGHIETTDGQVVVENITGTWMGYLDIDGERWFDLREQPNDLPDLTPLPFDSRNPLCLESDCRLRADFIEISKGPECNLDNAQEEKVTLEIKQRRDRALRAAAQKRREAGGPKITYPDNKHKCYSGI